MRHLKLILPILPATAMAIYPFMLFKSKVQINNTRIIRHEMIHFRQQIELLVIPFYVLYLFNFLLNLLIYRHWDMAYRNICFEREAYAMESRQEYLNQRRTFAWVNYLKIR